MNYLRLEHVSKSYGEKVLFSDVDLLVNKGDKTALVAKNGSGKSTLLRVIGGFESPEGENAHIWMHKDTKVYYLEQEPDLDDRMSILDTVLYSDDPTITCVREHQHAVATNDQEALARIMTRMEELKAWDAEARIMETLSKLRLTDLEQKVGNLSGGQRKRVAIAQMVLSNADFLILDEPTNHLDLDMIEWLEEYLQQSQLTVFMVTHDRYFLENVCNRIVELDQGKLYSYPGNYAEFLEKKTARQINEATRQQKAHKLMKTELEWVRRMPKARGTKAKARLDKFQEIKAEAKKRPDDQELRFTIDSERLGSKIVEFHQAGFSYGENVILKPFTYKFKKRERVGIVGPNGAGKSTFLKLMTGELSPDKGKIVIGDTVKFGYFSQDGMDLKEDKRMIDVVRDIAEYLPMPKGQKLTAESLLERFLFPRSQQQVYVSQLSGGEKRRLHLLTVLMENPNFLILDEPTNDLDILTLNVLEQFLQDFEGCLVIVTHDRYFMDKLVDHLFILEGNGDISDFNGFYSEYRASQQLLAESSANKSEKSGKSSQTSPSPSGNEIDRETRKVLKRLENKLSKLENEKKELMASFHSGELDTEGINKASARLGEVNEEIEELEMEWMEIVDRQSSSS